MHTPPKTSQEQRPKRKNAYLLHSTAFIIGCIFIIAGGVVWILSAEKVISGIWSSMLPIVFIVVGVIAGFGQLLFASLSHASQHPIHLAVTVSPSTMSSTLVQTPSLVEQQAKHEIIWNVPYRRNPFFTGREEILKKLYENLMQTTTSAHTQLPALTGLGGIGKTQLAIEYAYRHKAEYHYIFWINATSRETIIEGFTNIARLLALPTKDEPDQNIMIANVRQWLTRHEEWLLIMDNADNSLLVTEFLPTCDNGHILLTTREQAWGPIAHNIAVEKMSEPEGTLFLLRRAKIFNTLDAPLFEASNADQVKAAAIVREMDGLPLALDQAGAYIEETPSTLDAYLKVYNRQKTKLLQERGKALNTHPNAVATTWSLNYKQVEQLNPMAANLLRLLAFLAPDAIPEEMIIAGASELSPRLQVLATDETLLDQPLKVLHRFSLIKRDMDKRMLYIHRLVQADLRASMTPKSQRNWAERTVRAINRAFPDVTDIEQWEYCEHLLPHAFVCARLIIDYKIELAEAAQLLDATGRYLYGHGQYTEAEQLYQHALTMRKNVLEPNHPDIALSLHHLATLFYLQGRYEQAEPLYQHALSIRENALGPNHSDTAKSLKNLAIVKQMQGKNEQAEPLFQRALAIDESVLGPNHPNTATSLNNLAEFYYRQGKDEQAEPLFQRALTIDESVLGPNHPNTATCLDNLAALYHRQGKNEQAEPLHQRALAIYESVLGPNHPDTATSLVGLARLYSSQNKYEQAEAYYQRALTIYESAMGPKHPYIATTLNDLANLYISQKKYEQVEPLYQRALDIREQVLGTEHPATVEVRANYNHFLQGMDK